MTQNFSGLLGQIWEGYELKSILKHNNTRAVFHGVNSINQNEVAIKVLALNTIFSEESSKEELARFKREAALIIDFDHPNIISIEGYKDRDDFVYFIMPFYKNGTLGDFIRSHGSIPLADTVRFIAQAASALDYAHARKIVHRDIKPDNFLLAPNGQLILSDFGIARQDGNITSITVNNAIHGTPGFIAPEVLQGCKADPRADIYALGMVIYTMLHFTPPFPVDTVLRKAIAPHCSQRYNSAGELAIALAEAATDTALYNAPTETHFASPTIEHQALEISQTTRPIRRSFVLLFGVFFVLLLLVVGSLIMHFPAPNAPLANQPVSTSSMIQQAQATVETYYQDWNEGEYQTEYNLLSPDYQKTYPWNQAQQDYKKVLRVDYKITNTSVKDDSVKMSVITNEFQRNSNRTGNECAPYKLYFIARQIQGSWRLTAQNVHGPLTSEACELT